MKFTSFGKMAAWVPGDQHSRAARLRATSLCSSRRKEAQFLGTLNSQLTNQRLLASAATALNQALSLLLLALGPGLIQSRANPVGGTVAQGAAAFSGSGSQLNIRTSDRAYINWQSFNIGVGETTTFIQPSASSLVWNNIHDANPSQILGSLHANGYVVLQNQAGFFIGGQAAISAHGFLMTTAPIPMPDLTAGGAWSFNSPPASASIINYGQISTDKGGSLFLIAQDIQNKGTLSAPEGNIGLYAGKQVLVSERPDGR